MLRGNADSIVPCIMEAPDVNLTPTLFFAMLGRGRPGLAWEGGGGGGPSKRHLGPDPHLGVLDIGVPSCRFTLGTTIFTFPQAEIRTLHEGKQTTSLSRASKCTTRQKPQPHVKLQPHVRDPGKGHCERACFPKGPKMQKYQDLSPG